MFGASRRLSLKSWKICAPQWGVVIYFPFSVPDSECSANIELNGPGQSSFLRSIISRWLGVLSNSISSTIYQSQLRFTFALADVNLRLAVSPRSLRFSRSELNCWGDLFSKKKSWSLFLGGEVFDGVFFPPNAPCSAATELQNSNLHCQFPSQLSSKWHFFCSSFPVIKKKLHFHHVFTLIS